MSFDVVNIVIANVETCLFVRYACVYSELPGAFFLGEVLLQPPVLQHIVQSENRKAQY